MPEDAPRQAAENIATICALEAEAERPLSAHQRLAEAVAEAAGNPVFASAHLARFVAWAAANLGWLAPLPVFDEVPFPLLGTLLAMEAVLLSCCVLIRQNRMAEQAEERSHIDLQINLLAERESTKIIQMLSRIATELGIARAVMDAEAEELGEATTLDGVARKLREERGGPPPA